MMGQTHRPWPVRVLDLSGYRHPPVHREQRDLARAKYGGKKA